MDLWCAFLVLQCLVQFFCHPELNSCVLCNNFLFEEVIRCLVASVVYFLTLFGPVSFSCDLYRLISVNSNLLRCVLFIHISNYLSKQRNFLKIFGS